MSIEDVAQELYGLAPEDFTSARNARAKEAKAGGDPELAAGVQALRKPTTGAWLLNQLVREHGDEVQQVLELGAQLRAAQGSLGGDELRALDRQRRQLTRAVAGQAGALGRAAGRRVTAQVISDVEETLRSAMVDAAAGEALSTGLLTDTFSSTGIDPVDLSAVLALGGSGPHAKKASSRKAPSTTPAAAAADEEPEPRHERALADAREALAHAESALRAASEESARAQEQAAHAQQVREQVEAERAELRRRLQDLDEQVTTAAGVEQATTRAREEAARDEASAVEAAAEARRRLEELQ